MELINLLKQACIKWLGLSDTMADNTESIKELEAGLCFQQTNEVFQKARKLEKAKVDYFWPDEMNEQLRAAFQVLIEEYIDTYESLPMYCTEFILSAPDDAEETVSITIDYVFPPEYSNSSIVFWLEIIATESEEKGNEDSTKILLAP